MALVSGLQDGGGFSELPLLLSDDLQKLLFGREVDQILVYKDGMRQVARGVMHKRVVLFRTEDNPDGQVVAFGHFIFAVVVEIQVHLPGVGVIEGAYFEVNQHMALQNAMVKYEVNTIMPVVE